MAGGLRAAAGVSPFLIMATLALNRLESTTQPATGCGWTTVVALTVTLGLGAVAAADMWNLVFTTGRGIRTPCNESFDLGPAVRVKEDLEVLRLLLANSGMVILSVLVALLPLGSSGLLVVV